MTRTEYYGTERQLSQREQMQARFTQMGTSYLQGTTTIAEIQYMLDHEIYHYLFSRKEAQDYIRYGVGTAINDAEMNWEGNAIPVLPSRLQPEQDAAEVALIAARKKRTPKVEKHNKAVRVPFSAKEVEEAGQYGWVQCHISIKP